jgi:D-3-phosphoglycerate dehydrogenase / 2-oxoglutarate reductase
MRRPRFLVINGSSLDLIGVHQEWVQQQGVDITASPGFKKLTQAQFEQQLEGMDAVIGPAAAAVELTPNLMETHQGLKVISLASSGYEWVDIEAATRYGIVVMFANTPSLSEVVADHTFGMLLAAARQIPHHHQQLQAGDASRGMGAMVWERTLGIVGLGNIGRRVARRAAGFGMTVIAAEIKPDLEYMQQHGIELVPLDVLMCQADFVSIHARLNTENYHLIGAREIALMKATAFLINTARQKLVDEAALTRAIVEGRIAGAAIDDPPEDKASPLLRHPNVVFTPHIGNRVPESNDSVCRCAYTNALDVLQGRRPDPRFLLNPEVYAGQIRSPLPKDR